MSLRQSSQTNGGEEVDGEAGVSGVVPREEAFEKRLQGPKNHNMSNINQRVWVSLFVLR